MRIQSRQDIERKLKRINDMMKLETRIKNKQRTIRKQVEKIANLERDLSGLEELRIFMMIHKEEFLQPEKEIEVDTDIYRYFFNWPTYITWNGDDGSYYSKSSHSISFDRRGTYYIKTTRDNVLDFFEKCYPQMREKIFKSIHNEKITLTKHYEDYGRLFCEA